MRRDRLASAGLVAAIHAAALFMLLQSRTVPTAQDRSSFAIYDVAPPPVPPPLVPTVAPTGPLAAAPSGVMGRRATRTPLVAPSPILPPPSSPIIAAAVAGDGGAPAGGSAQASVGTGAGREGGGAGAGGPGSGEGDGGMRARLLTGAIRDRDYPAAERRARVEGSTTVTFTVGANGRATGCTVARSSGSTALDAATCRLIEQRFRYAPALDGAGRPTPERRGWRQDWWLERRD